MNVVTNEQGTITEEQSFDAWGRRRNPQNWTYTNVPASYKFYRGYTGHEQLDQFGLINMNGRMYDPAVGRFLSADNVVQAPDFTQSYNRYSYCFNNPLKYTDPSGWTAFGGGSTFDVDAYVQELISQGVDPNVARMTGDAIRASISGAAMDAAWTRTTYGEDGSAYTSFYGCDAPYTNQYLSFGQQKDAYEYAGFRVNVVGGTMQGMTTGFVYDAQGKFMENLTFAETSEAIEVVGKAKSDGGIFSMPAGPSYTDKIERVNFQVTGYFGKITSKSYASVTTGKGFINLTSIKGKMNSVSLNMGNMSLSLDKDGIWSLSNSVLSISSDGSFSFDFESPFSTENLKNGFDVSFKPNWENVLEASKCAVIVGGVVVLSPIGL